MMDKEQIKWTRETGELQLKTGDKLTHYGIVLYILLIPTCVVCFTLYDLFVKGRTNFRTELVWLIVITLALGSLFYRLQKRRLAMTKVKTNLSRTEIEKVIEGIANESKWSPYQIDDEVIIAKTHPGFWSGSWGEQITVIFDKGQILVNSICDPDNKSSVTSMGRNRRNIKQLIDRVDAASRQQNV